MQRKKIEPYKKELLYRKAQGKLIVDHFKLKLNFLFPEQTDLFFLDLQETDRIIDSVKSKHIISEDLTCFNDYLASRVYITSKLKFCGYYLLLDNDWKYCGAVLLKAGFKISELFDFDKVLSDEVRLVSNDISEMVTIDYNNSFGNEPYECKFIQYN